MRNPFRRSSSPYGKRTSEYTTGSRPLLYSNKLRIVAAIVTVIVIIVVMSESIVVIQAGHRGVVLYVGAVEKHVLG